tara:strand:+ start:338 stop:601 length:264 start_codon:yes stop_codon:yes gene_type:complete
MKKKLKLTQDSKIKIKKLTNAVAFDSGHNFLIITRKRINIGFFAPYPLNHIGSVLVIYTCCRYNNGLPGDGLEHTGLTVDIGLEELL